MAEFNDGLAEYGETAEYVGAAEYAVGAAELKKMTEVPVHDEREICGENIPSENCEAGVWRRLFIVFSARSFLMASFTLSVLRFFFLQRVCRDVSDPDSLIYCRFQ